MNRYIFLILIFFCFNCSYKEIKKKEILNNSPIQQNFAQDTTDDIELVYNRLIEAIIKKKVDQIVECYCEDAIFEYSDKVEKEINCFDGSKRIQGHDKIRKNYEYLFKNRYLNRIEYDIVKIDKKNNPPKIIFINLWLNLEYDFYEIIEFTLINKKYYINYHKIVKGKEIRDTIEGK